MNNKARYEVFLKRIPIYKNNPVLFAREVLKFEPEDYQEKMLTDLAHSPKVSCKSGQGVGKTAIEAVAALWFLCCYPYARVVATAPTLHQLNDVLWGELNKWISKSPLLGMLLNWTKTYLYVKGYESRWFAVARTASQPENMQGFHEDNMLFIIDEASGVDDSIMEAILGTLSGENNKLLMCGNPTKTSGTFFDSHTRDRALYKCHTVSSLDSRRTNKENIEMFRRKYGADSNVFRVRVLGEFPTQEDDVFIPLPLIEQSTMRETEIDVVRKITFGVDVARFGDDETVIARNINGKINIPVVRHGQNLMTTVGDIVILYRKTLEEFPDYKGVITVIIDDTGLGGGVTDRLQEVKMEEHLNRLEIIPVNFATKPPQDDRGEHYANISTYMWATIRDLMEAEEISIDNSDDNVEETVAQLSVRKYSVTSNGKIVLESKEEMKKRGIKSPDRADSIALSCYTVNKVYNDFIEKVESIIIPLEAVASMPIIQINIGISIGTVSTGASFVATGIIAGYSRVVVLAAEKYEGEIETNTLDKSFGDFAKNIRKKFFRLDYVYCDNKEQFLYRCIKESAQKNNINAVVRVAANTDITNRIRLTTRLITQGRLFITENCEPLSRAFSSAVWTEARQKDTRNASTDECTLSAFEYTIERDANKFLNGG